jgi:hypothetical protein
MSEWDAFDAIVIDVKALTRSLPPEHLLPAEASMIICEVLAAQARGRPSDALALLETEAPGGASGLHALRSDGWREMARARSLTELGRLDEAAALIDATRSLAADDGPMRVQHLELEAICAARQGDARRSLACTDAILAVPQATLLRLLGTGGTLELLVRLAKELRSHGHDRLARQALDCAATCAVERIVETERAVRALPELAQVSREDFELLGRARMRYAGEHRDLLRSLARLFEGAAARGEPWLDALRSGDQALVCAWCERVRARGGVWVPVGHYLPREGPLLMTHGICSDCATIFLA